MEVSFQPKALSTHPQIIYVLGGPGSGKGTQCERLVRDFQFTHISVGDIMRAEIKSGTADGKQLEPLVSKGEIVPTEITVRLLLKTIFSGKSQRFLIDGFPRGLEQALQLENQFREIDFILNFDCPEEVLVQRLLERGLTSGRADDNESTIRNRIKVFNESTRPTLYFYSQFNRVHNIQSIGSVEEVYNLVLQKLKKNVIFLYGAPCIGKSLLAKDLSNSLGYFYLDLKEFYKSLKKNTEEERVNSLMKYLGSSAEDNFIIDSFFESKKQLKIYLDNFDTPRYVIHFEATKDVVEERINQRCENLKKLKEVKNQEFESYLSSRKEILLELSKKSFFVKIDINNESMESAKKKIISNYLSPEIFMAIADENQELFQHYVTMLENERDFTFLSVETLLNFENKRKLKENQLNKQIREYIQTGQIVPINLQIELIRKTIFRDSSKKKFVLTGFPTDFDAYTLFEQECCEIKYVMSFLPENKKIDFFCDRDPHFSPQTYYYFKGKHMIIDRPSIHLFDYYTQPRNSYYLAIAPPGCGKTTASKHISSKFGYKIIEWEETITKLKEKLGGENGPLEELPFPELIKYFKELFVLLQGKTPIVLDGFPFSVSELDLFLKGIGQPSGIIDLEVTKESIIKGHRRKNEIDAEAEIPEEEIENIMKNAEKSLNLSEYLVNYAQEFFAVNYYRINGNISIPTILKSLDSIFYNKVYVVNHSLPIYSEGSCDDPFMAIFANICCRNNVCFVDVRELIRKQLNTNGELKEKLEAQYLMRWSEKPIDFPSNYTPDTIIELIKSHLVKISGSYKEILLFNYPMGDYDNERNGEEMLFPRALDEISLIENAFGPIRIYFTIYHDEEKKPINEYNDPIEEFPPEEKPIVENKKQDNDDDGNQPPPSVKGDEEEKPKFNPKEFTWTVTDGKPKTSGQIYSKMKSPIWENIVLSDSLQNCESLNNCFENCQHNINEGGIDNYYFSVWFKDESA